MEAAAPGKSPSHRSRCRRGTFASPVPEEAAAVEEALERAADAVECWMDEGAIATMNRFNRKVGKEESET